MEFGYSSSTNVTLKLFKQTKIQLSLLSKVWILNFHERFAEKLGLDEQEIQEREQKTKNCKRMSITKVTKFSIRWRSMSYIEGVNAFCGMEFLKR